MSHKTQMSGEQAAARVDVLEQRNGAEHGAGRGHRKGKPEPGALTQGGQVVDLEADWAVLAADEPPPHVVQVGCRRRLG